MPAQDNHRSGNGIEFPAKRAEAITPDDANDIVTVTRALYVGSAGDVRVDMADGSDVTFSSVPSGTVLPLRVRRVYATGTTASGIVGLS